MFKKHKILIGIIAALVSVGFIIFYGLNEYEQKCGFEISDVQEYKGSYGERQANYVVYEGLIRNISSNDQYLRAMIAKLYSDDEVFLKSGYASINANLKSGSAIPFKVNVQLDTYHDTVLRKYYNPEKINSDIYPWFEDCK